MKNIYILLTFALISAGIIALIYRKKEPSGYQAPKPEMLTKNLVVDSIKHFPFETYNHFFSFSPIETNHIWVESRGIYVDIDLETGEQIPFHQKFNLDFFKERFNALVNDTQKNVCWFYCLNQRKLLRYDFAKKESTCNYPAAFGGKKAYKLSKKVYFYGLK